MISGNVMYEFLSVVFLIAASVTPITEPIPEHPEDWIVDYGKGCKVQVFKTREEAKQGGEIVQVCKIEGSSSGSMGHTVEIAVKKHAKKACKCDTNKVFIHESQPMGMWPAKVTMIAFKYKGDSSQESTNPYDAIKRKKD